MTEPTTQAQPPPDDSAFLLQFLRDRDAACPLCGYNLRNLSSPRCPECGKEVTLAVALAEPYLKAWIIAMVPLCAGAGIGVLFALAFITERGPAPPGKILAVSAAFWLMIPWVALTLFSRRRFLRLPRSQQSVIAFFATAYFVVALITFVIVARD